MSRAPPLARATVPAGLGTLTGVNGCVSMSGVNATVFWVRCSQVTQTRAPSTTRMSLSPPLPPWSIRVARNGPFQVAAKSSENATQIGLFSWFESIQEA